MTTEELRESGIKALGTVLKQEKNIKIIEKYIHKNAENAENSDNSESYENIYRKIIYQSIGDILKGINLKDMIKNIKKDMVDWQHPTFKNIKNRIEEHDEFIINPFEVEEGVTTCKKCGSGRVFTYQKQCRGSDEPMSTFAKCVKCKEKWTYSG